LHTFHVANPARLKSGLDGVLEACFVCVVRVVEEAVESSGHSVSEIAILAIN
jgi:hypothetical protein